MVLFHERRFYCNIVNALHPTPEDRDGSGKEEKKMTKQEILTAAMRQSAIDCCCAEEDFRRETHIVVENKASEQTSKFLVSPNACRMISYGSNIVASCRQELIPEIEAFINRREKFYRCFEPLAIYELNHILQRAGEQIAWMHSYYLPDPDAVFSADLTCPYETKVMHPEDFTDLYGQGWDNALSRIERKELDMLGVGAYDGDRLIGLAACSADCVEMWQIGIDVLPEYRRKGVASVLTNRLARESLNAGRFRFTRRPGRMSGRSATDSRADSDRHGRRWRRKRLK